ncbi:S8 family peptidase [Fundidesulfovibrio agrisoli]|uniref:S8 family peptidase n=1 Tax=Fundidesulfovibrio agrisoli TaxID=2922717 RepID=UPI001FABA9E3|nr:S8 family serine peptidase [Fundidesulfovibrio agrisoli]
MTYFLRKIFVAFLLLTVPALAQAGDKSLRWVDIPQASVTSSGQARVIVTLDVPGISELTGASRAATLDPSKDPGAKADAALAEAARTADAALERGIASVAQAVAQSADPSSLAKGAAAGGPRVFKTVPGMALAVSQSGLEALKADPRVLNIQVDEAVPLIQPAKGGGSKAGAMDAPAADLPPDTTQLAQSAPMIGADKVWAKGWRGQGWYVAILDTGIRRTHEMFTGKTIREGCYSASANCPNGQTSMFGTGAAAHYSNAYAGWDHGTHVAGIAAGKKPDGTLSGIAKGANIIAVNVFSIFTATSDVRSYTSDQILGLEYVYSLRNTYKIGAVNMSLGGGQYFAACDTDTRKAAIDNLASVNIATCIASGNNGYCDSVGAPGCVSTAVTVGAVTKSDEEAYYNNWAPNMVDFWAPGSSITSSTGDTDTSYEAWDGTSMATPHVTGTWTLMRQRAPSESVSTIQTRLTNGGVSVQTACSDGGYRPRISIFTSQTWPLRMSNAASQLLLLQGN